MARTDTRKRESEDDALFAKASEQWDRGGLRSAFRLFLAGAKRGDPSAQQNLGYFYDVGLGVKPNRRMALLWYNRAFRQGYGTAASNIGTIFRDEKKIASALSWFQRAVKLGDSDANLEIAKIYISELGEPDKAVPYLRRTVQAKPDDVTKASQLEARRLLRQLSRKNRRRAGPPH